jgi:putative selenate reductase molybdopterin-binding subunit
MQKTVKTSWAINGPADAHEGLGIALGLRSLQSAAKGAVQVYLGIDEDGSVWLEAGAVEPRAGALDTLTGVVRTAMGLGADVPVSVRPVRTDGLLSFHDFDRGPAPTLVVAQAVLQAAKELKRRLSRIYRRLKATDSTVPAWDFSAPHRLRDLVRANQESLTPLSLIAHGTASVQGLPPALAVAAVRLRVDPATYAIQVRHIVLGLDVGRVLNHADLRIIVQDRVMRALREALWGELGPSRLTHLPPLSLIIEENPAPNGPLGAKGLGEAADAPIAPALVNGLYHATGIWMPHLPLTPERIRQSAHRALKLHPHAPPSALSGA